MAPRDRPRPPTRPGTRPWVFVVIAVLGVVAVGLVVVALLSR
ncbi:MULTISPECIES: hypothetical protein [unclassified Curtobacterium]|jgi:hypothetical protein|nr:MULTISPECIES: hypothetical protein [unclassified Curtobacterium]MCY1694141.1 hypothetical protein [Curtobacterium sp. SL109]